MIDSKHAHPPEWWPLQDGEPIGEERARELVFYLRLACPPAEPVQYIAKVGTRA